MSKKRTTDARHWQKTKAGYLRWMLNRYVDLGQDLSFINDCKNFGQIDRDTPVEKQHIVETLASKFFVKWGVFPLPSWLLNNDLFRQMLEKHWERIGEVINLTITPATTLREVKGKYKEFKRNLKKKHRSPNLPKLRSGLILKYLQDIPPLFRRVTAGDLALAMGSKAKRGRVEYDFSAGEKTTVLSDIEIDLQDTHLKMLVGKGVPRHLAVRQATRLVIKKRWKEPRLAPKLRMASNRTFKQFIEMIS